MSTGLHMIRECSKSGVTGKFLKGNIPHARKLGFFIVSSNSIPKITNHVNYLFHRSSACERPRTYDKFYRKGPSNFQGAAGEKGHMQQDHAKTHCSSDEEDIPKVTSGGSQRNKRKKKRKGSEKLQYSRTITEKDVRSIERHLSMKKTIRKKIMRDLQQAFVEGDPNEISAPTETIPSENVNNINLKSLNIGPKQNSKSDPNVLDLLRGEEESNQNHTYSDDSGHCSGPSPKLQTHQHSQTRLSRSNVTKVPIAASKQTRYNFISDSGGSSCGGDESLENVVCEDRRDEDIVVLATDQIGSSSAKQIQIPAENLNTNAKKNSKYKHIAAYPNSNIAQHNKNSNYMNSYLTGKTVFSVPEKNVERNYVNAIAPKGNKIEAVNKSQSSNGKKTLWQKLTRVGGGNCNSKNCEVSKRSY